ncbi:MAG: L-serine ammonia-lyase [Alphaproteobacteria bacterium]|nr:MAG: L-serine ammonia-lyase [Alphaproteobacteria bacterium]
MNLSFVDLFTIGIGPSSSHTVGPMRAAARFVHELQNAGHFEEITGVIADLYGSLALTGSGHGTDKALLAGLSGKLPESTSPDEFAAIAQESEASSKLMLGGTREIAFSPTQHIRFNFEEVLDEHPNGMRFTALSKSGPVFEMEFYSVGGGFVLAKGESAAAQSSGHNLQLPHPFTCGDELLAMADGAGKTIAEIMLANEGAWRSEEETLAYLHEAHDCMSQCIERGCAQDGILPGRLKVPRRAKAHYERLKSQPERALKDPLTTLDWINLFALAVSEENASGGRVVTAPTNGAAGVIPAVIAYYERFCSSASKKGVEDFLLTAAAIGVIYKKRASISGAEVGCQGEVGVACSMAAAGLAAALGGTNEQIENAAEIGMEHNLGLTCDPVAGLVQVPCIERNAMGATKAINAARLALLGTGKHMVSLDKVIETMRQTGLDMASKYKETSQGGLAVNVVEC